ncbi:dihydrodipicolinate synthase family protein [Thermobifida halotolerans]|uniref:Dihydrodipicolinate synthase family protein n=1 Tax=Thermobifida halotolerans TaxID=483545 RepID=A0A399G0P5_9ACTN|nr:dihydrodipicolinate synthase family protein [Thermobifida halotolerans]UOE18566.1 dihydrodipicolinate synthase family protein [Thermobifida halotolerans]
MYSGTIVPLVTPFDPTGAVSKRDVVSLIEYVHADVTALMPTLSSGEGWRLTERQWHDMVSYTVANSHGLPVLVGIQLPDTEGVLRRARLARAMGADAVVVTTPFRMDITQEEIYQHYRTLREGVDLPIFLYNEEAVSGNRIEYETMLRLCELPGVVGVKESSGSPEFTRKLAAAGTGVPVFEGWENLLLASAGIDGFVGPLANLEPGLCNAMLVDPTPDRQEVINAVCENYGVFEDDWYARVKQELGRRGVITPQPSLEQA